MEKFECELHPKYRGKARPKTACPKCLSIYFTLHDKPRILPMPTKIIKNKKIYNRTKKHKQRGE